MKRIIILIISLITGNIVFAQHARIVTSGSIEFEKTINMFAVKKQIMDAKPDPLDLQFYDAYKSRMPQFKKMNSTLVFGDNKSLFTPALSADNILSLYGDAMAMQFNTVYNDYTTNTTVLQKELAGTFFLVKDTTRKIKWKITDETRDIAGYTCRRANGVILDSVYIVAFYTDKIWVSGGPESFNGLPGMILGVALPHENVTWYATKVNDMTVPPNTLIPPKKGKAMTWAELKENLHKTFNGTGPPGFYRRKVFAL